MAYNIAEKVKEGTYSTFDHHVDDITRNFIDEISVKTAHGTYMYDAEDFLVRICFFAKALDEDTLGATHKEVVRAVFDNEDVISALVDRMNGGA